MPLLEDKLQQAIDAQNALTQTVSAQLARCAPQVSPTFSGTPSAPTAPLGDDSTQLATTAFVQRALTMSSPPGCVAFFARDTAPEGWLKCDGAVVSRTTYVALFTALGTTFGAGNGATTFTLPDLRGEFVRGWDNGRGVDGGRGLGSWQKGSALAAFSPQSGVLSGLSAGTGAGQTHRQSLGYDDDPNALATYSGVNHYAVTGTGGSSGDWMHTIGGGVARPRNVALLACIKY